MEKQIVHKFSPAPYQVMAAEKGTAMIMVDKSPNGRASGFNGTRGKLVGIEDGKLVMEVEDKILHLYNFKLSFGKDLLPAFRSWGSS